MKLKENWVFDTKEQLSCSPAILNGDDQNKTGIIFTTKQGKVCELNRFGKINWLFDAKVKLSEKESMFVDEEAHDSINAKPLILLDKKTDTQRIIFGSQNHNIYCLDENGVLLWTVKTDGPIKASPVFIKPFNEEQPVLICGSYDKHIYFINLDGTIVKKLFVREEVETSPTIVGEKLFIGTKTGKVIALNKEGEEIWTFSTNKKVSAKIISTTLHKNEKVTLLVGSQDNTLYALSTDGEVLWTYETKGAINSEAVVLPFNESFEREIIFGSCDNTVYCLNQNGELLWSYETEFWVVSPPLVGKHHAGHIVIVGSYDHNVYVLDGAGSYNLDYIPGLSGVINQTGFQSGSLSKDAGQHKGKKISNFTTESFVVGCSLIPATREIVVSTKKGKIYNLKMS